MSQENDFYQVSLKVILKNKNGQILLLKEGSESSSAGYYDLPGGRMTIEEFNVSFSDIIKREIIEEVGDIKFVLNTKPIAVGRYLIFLTNIHVLYLFFEAKYLSGEIYISNEHDGFKWADFSQEAPETLLKSGNLEGIKTYLNL